MVRIFYFFQLITPKPIIMYEGIVKSIDESEGKGYILEKSGDLIMFLLSSLEDPSITEEDKVVYSVAGIDEKQAVNVRKYSSDS